MATEALSHVHSQLETLFHQGISGSLTDGELLARFLTGDAPMADAAFAILIDRHGSMVMRVCRAALGREHDAEDASQAVFLVLAQRAGSVRRHESAASWLYGVARRVSARASRDQFRRRRHERRSAELRPRETADTMDAETHEELYREIDRLPGIYRSAVVLCYLEGRSHEEAASWLRCPIRTLQSRLLRAKERLRVRLARRGERLPAVLPQPAKAISPSAGWAASVIKAAKGFSAPQGSSAIGVSTAAIALAESSMRSGLDVPRLVAVAILTVGLGALGVMAARGGFGPASTMAPSMAAAQEAAAQPAKNPKNRTLHLRVIDRGSNSPIEGAEVTIETDSGARIGLGGEPEVMARLTTDRDGRCKIEFPQILPKEIVITTRKASYANRGYGPFLETGGGAIPSDHEVKMERGVTIGGVVKAREGKPVSGATVSIMARAGADNSPDWTYVPEVKVITDSHGRWRFDEMPTGWRNVYVSVTHPDYVPTFMQRDFPIPSDFDLKAKKAEVILEEGFAILGRVLDDQGRPIEGANVALGADRQIMQSGFPNTSTDPEGRFRFGHVPAGAQTLTAQASGHSPEYTDLVVSPELKPVEFRLGPGHVLKGRVVDQAGKPLDGVTVQAMNWKGHMSLDWKTKTNAEGRFDWDSAPAEPVLITLTRPGYVMVSQREFRSGGEVTTVTMYPPLRVRGKVTDRTTGKPIARFTIVPGTYYRSSNRRGEIREPHWDRRAPWQDLGDGNFEIEYAHALVDALAVRVEAKGYKPATSETFNTEAGDVTFDAKLEPGPGPSGIVLGRDGRALAGASVVLSTKTQRAQLYNAKFHEGVYPQVVTGADGRFSFPAQTEPFRVFADHHSGFAEADEKALAGSSRLSITPWGRIEGMAKIGSHPAAGVQIRLSETDNRWNPNEALPITQSQQVTTDSRGHYAFERVIPARLSVSRIFTLERSSHHVGTGAFRFVTAKPGETAWADLGGTGRPVIGRFKPPAGTKPGAVFRSSPDQSLERIRPEPPYPLILKDDEREAWLVEWLKTDAGKVYSDGELNYDTNVRPDGSFRVEDVPAGKYRLQAHLHEPSSGVPGTWGRELASIETEITVPEMPGGRSDQPLDLGTIDLAPSRR